MNRRLELQTILEELLGSKNVYFQPPENIKLKYPCIVYDRVSADHRFADNKLYSKRKRYKVTVMDYDPDSSIPDQIARLPLCRFDTHYGKDNLNHDVYTLYY